ncbi:unnamed protein product [Coffea canephora]|uniref:Protein kinase domain-containing protein n=1 Tax=Coffea canephora TaxID=49390 RepID=A0A068URX1_COFCA|nr:unnamed protein product [Coffea canephora]
MVNYFEHKWIVPYWFIKSSITYSNCSGASSSTSNNCSETSRKQTLLYFPIMRPPKLFFLLFLILVVVTVPLYFLVSIINLTVIAGVTIIVFSGLILLRKRRQKKQKQGHFERNGGLLLEKQLCATDGAIEKTRIFISRELEAATDGFNESRILGQGGQVNHRNVVKLLGCCLETEVPLLVYEFIPNGTLFNLIQNDNEAESFPFTWSLRLKVATEVAGALAYLHSGLSIPVFHRDIKSTNILLDGKYIAKVSDFGASLSIAIDKTHMTTRVQGTFGYIDPEYFLSSQITDKSDVYSFGVVLLELLTRQKPIPSREEGEDVYLGLAQRFLTSMEENSLPTILDPQIIDQTNEEEVIAVAKLAQRCINWDGRRRPTMKEVSIELENIKMSRGDLTIQENYQSPSCTDEEAVVMCDVYHTWTIGNENVKSTSDAYAVLNNTTFHVKYLNPATFLAIEEMHLKPIHHFEDFVNEVVILSQVSHRTVVKLLGCRLLIEVPLLVYEFIPNRSLHNLIHNQSDDDFRFTYNLRLRIAIEIAGSLAYLHILKFQLPSYTEM